VHSTQREAKAAAKCSVGNLGGGGQWSGTHPETRSTGAHDARRPVRLFDSTATLRCQSGRCTISSGCYALYAYAWPQLAAEQL